MNAITSIQRVLIRDLNALRREINAYPNQSDLWLAPPGISNSAGSLTLHLTGNISHFIGAVIGENGYVRNRDAEFTDKNIDLVELERRIDVAIQSVEDGLSEISDLDLEKPYPILLGELQLTIGQFLIHLVSHFGYHLGQIDYHRRIVTGSNATIGAENIAELT
ncbi:MAG: DinB family protein [bacterium]|nr:DinB family protein [bacterium]